MTAGYSRVGLDSGITTQQAGQGSLEAGRGTVQTPLLHSDIREQGEARCDGPRTLGDCVFTGTYDVCGCHQEVLRASRGW